MSSTFNGAVAQLALTFAFTREQLVEMATLQGEANDVMADDWRSQNNMTLPFFRAGHIESTEAVQHMGFKWWKKEEPAVMQTEMELIDILHFALSDALRANSHNPEVMADSVLASTESVNFWAIGRYANTFFQGSLFERTPENPRFAKMLDISGLEFNDIAEQFIARTILQGGCDMALLYSMFQSLGVTGNKAHALYVSKNALNKFRTANGQREGTYSKIWDSREDNDHLSEFVESQLAEGNTVTAQEIYNFLSRRYAQAESLEKA